MRLFDAVTAASATFDNPSTAIRQPFENLPTSFDDPSTATFLQPFDQLRTTKKDWYMIVVMKIVVVMMVLLIKVVMITITK